MAKKKFSLSETLYYTIILSWLDLIKRLPLFALSWSMYVALFVGIVLFTDKLLPTQAIGDGYSVVQYYSLASILLIPMLYVFYVLYVVVIKIMHDHYGKRDVCIKYALTTGVVRILFKWLHILIFPLLFLAINLLYIDIFKPLNNPILFTIPYMLIGFGVMMGVVRYMRYLYYDYFILCEAKKYSLARKASYKLKHQYPKMSVFVYLVLIVICLFVYWVTTLIMPMVGSNSILALVVNASAIAITATYVHVVWYRLWFLLHNHQIPGTKRKFYSNDMFAT